MCILIAVFIVAVEKLVNWMLKSDPSAETLHVFYNQDQIGNFYEVVRDSKGSVLTARRASKEDASEGLYLLRENLLRDIGEGSHLGDRVE